MYHFDEERQLGGGDNAQASPQEDDVQFITSLQRPNLLTQLNQFLSQVDAEERGIERVLPEERSNQAPFSKPISSLLTCSIHMIISRYG
jgi:hypothetical protein